MRIVYIKNEINRESISFYGRIPWSIYFDNCNVVVITPLSEELKERASYSLIQRGEEIYLEVKDKRYKVIVFEWDVDKDKLIYAISIEDFPYLDRFEDSSKFIEFSLLFSKASYTVLERFVGEFDLLHIIDRVAWFLPLYLKKRVIVSNLTTPDMDILVSEEKAKQFEISDEWFYPEGIEYYGNISAYKTIILFSSKLIVEENRFKRFLLDFRKDGRLGFLKTHQHKVQPLSIGIDYNFLYSKYKFDYTKKEEIRNKLELMNNLAPSSPLLLLYNVSSFFPFFNSEIWLEKLERLLLRFPNLRVLFYLIDDSEKELAFKLRTKFPLNVGYITNNDASLKEVLAGTDIVLFPPYTLPYFDYLSLAFGNIVICNREQLKESNILKVLEPELRLGNSVVYKDKGLFDALYKAIFYSIDQEKLNEYIKRVVSRFPLLNREKVLFDLYKELSYSNE